MKKNYIIFVTFLLVIVLLFTANSFAEEKEGFVKGMWRRLTNVFRKPTVEEKTKPEPQPESKESPLAQLSEKEIRERIKYMLEISPEAADFIPDLKIAVDKNGSILKIEYRVGGVFKNVEGLDKETLIKIHNRVSTERTRIQTERIQRQLEQARAAQRISRPPRVYTPPSVPKTPTPPPTPPKVPAPPPSPPTPPRR